jgi:hypothetical protein
VRAWLLKCGFHYERFLAGEQKPNLDLDHAIKACEAGSAIPTSAAAHANLVLFKTRRGDVTQKDWAAYLERLQQVVMGVENRSSIWILVNAASKGVPLHKKPLLDAVDIVASRSGLNYMQYMQMGYFALDAGDANRALSYFDMAMQSAPHDNEMINDVFQDLATKGYAHWVTHLRARYQGTELQTDH